MAEWSRSEIDEALAFGKEILGLIKKFPQATIVHVPNIPAVPIPKKKGGRPKGSKNVRRK